MSASKMLSPERAGRIIALMAVAPKPILIHCQSGSDRTGLIAALYMKEVAGQDAQAAEKQCLSTTAMLASRCSSRRMRWTGAGMQSRRVTFVRL
ncbi:hypothetical protein DTW90_36745 [Neorhizobium sp. P12A]|nr:hypothetical protein DTW90_36745 [Neorhizobium sp. P12A]